MLWIILLGYANGLRTMTPLAVMSWFAYFGAYEPLPHSWAFWTTKLVTPILFTAAAFGEYVGDVLPQTPSRKSPPQAIARMVFGGIVGAIGAAANIQPAAGGALLGIFGAILGTWGGYEIRVRLARAFGRDKPAGLLESAFALALAIGMCFLIHKDSITSVHFQNM